MPARVYKTLGAGDSFLGTLLSMLIQGHGYAEAMRFAAAAASITISGKSCSDSMPSRDLLMSYMRAYAENAIEDWDGWKKIGSAG